MSSYDIVIRNGTVVDGTGAPSRHADVAISDSEAQVWFTALGITDTGTCVDSASQGGGLLGGQDQRQCGAFDILLPKPVADVA